MARAPKWEIQYSHRGTFYWEDTSSTVRAEGAYDAATLAIHRMRNEAPDSIRVRRVDWETMPNGQGKTWWEFRNYEGDLPDGWHNSGIQMLMENGKRPEDVA